MAITRSDDEVVSILTHNPKSMARVLYQGIFCPVGKKVGNVGIKGIGQVFKLIAMPIKKISNELFGYDNKVKAEKLAQGGNVIPIEVKNLDFIKTDQDARDYINTTIKQLRKFGIKLSVEENQKGEMALLINHKNLEMLNYYTPQIQKVMKKQQKNREKITQFKDKLKEKLDVKQKTKTQELEKIKTKSQNKNYDR